jgi:AcrR family transcriptional regulator
MTVRTTKTKTSRVEVATNGHRQVAKLDTILDAAEQVFGTFGYEGASMRLISEEAQVAQSLLHYHFESKERLYMEVFRRRAAAIKEYRKEKLNVLFSGPIKPTLEDVLRIFATSVPQLSPNKSRNAYYLQMVGEVTLATDDRSKQVVREQLDPIAKDIIAAFQRVLPTLSHDNAVWAYLFALGARQQAHAQNGRAQRLGSTLRDSNELLIPFLIKAVTALAEK